MEKVKFKKNYFLQSNETISWICEVIKVESLIIISQSPEVWKVTL